MSYLHCEDDFHLILYIICNVNGITKHYLTKMFSAAIVYYFYSLSLYVFSYLLEHFIMSYARPTKFYIQFCENASFKVSILDTITFSWVLR